MSERQKAIYEGATQMAAALLARKEYHLSDLLDADSQTVLNCLKLAAKMYNDALVNVKR